MKKLAAIVIVFVCLSFVVPSLGHARRYYGGPYRGCYGCGYSNNYWVPAAVLAGTVLAGALVIGAMNQGSRQPSVPQQTSYTPIDTRQPYAAPDPDFVARLSKKEPSGEWIIVPGQQVGNKWVPAHRVLVTNP